MTRDAPASYDGSPLTAPLSTPSMYPWIRMAKATLLPSGRRKVDLLATTSISLRVWPNDLDFNLHLNNGRYLTLADVGRMNWFVQTGLWTLARREKVLPVVGDALAKFRRELRPFQKFSIHTRMLGWDQRWGFLEHRFIRAGRAIGVVGVRGIFTRKSGPLEPEAFLSMLGASAESPPLPQWVIDWNNGCESLTRLLRCEEQDRGLR